MTRTLRNRLTALAFIALIGTGAAVTVGSTGTAQSAPAGAQQSSETPGDVLANPRPRSPRPR